MNDKTIAKFVTVQIEGNREVERILDYYNLDVNQRFESVCQDILNNLDTSSVTS